MLEFALTLGLADSINPVTIVVALYLASTPNAVRRLAGYVAGVFGVYLLGGLLLLFGPASLLRLATHGLDASVGRVVAVVLGVGAIAIAVVLWLRRDRMAKATVPDRALRPGSTLALGGAMTAIDLPTAFPLFVIAGAIVHEDLGPSLEAALLILYCAAYVVPLVSILALRAVGGERGERWLARLRRHMSQWAPIAIATLTFVVGVALVVYGAVA
jgi:cytochrome c biogenesis protein CcdA